MAYHLEMRTFPYAREQVFDLVADVESYPQFLPLWQHARIRQDNDNLYHTSQLIQLGPVSHRFQTQTRLNRPDSIEVRSDDSFFERFSILWSFVEATGAQTQVRFRLHCEARSRLMRPVFDLVLAESSRSIVDAFERRARLLCGAGP